MKRPIIKGTVLHKKSIALAKRKSIVTPASVGADPTLVQAGEWMGKSNVGEPIDFTIDAPDLDWSKAGKNKKKKKKEETEEEKLARLAEKDVNKTIKEDKKSNKLSNKYNDYVEYMQSQRLDNQIIGEDTWLDLSKRERRNLTKSDKPGTVFSRTLDKIKKAIENAKTKKEKNRLEKKKLKEENRLIKEEKFIELDPKTAKLLPVTSDDKLIKADEYVPKTTADTDRFVDTAEKFGFDMSTQEGWRQAEEALEYSDQRDQWEYPRGTAEEIFTEKDPELIAIIEQEEREKKAKKKEVKKKKAKEIELKNIEIRKRNQIKNEAREYYGPNAKLTQSKLDEYIKRKAAGEFDESIIDIIEQDDPEPGDPNYEKFIRQQKIDEFVRRDVNNNNIPDYLEVEPEFKSSDLERKKSGPFEQERNDRIWGYAKKSGLIHKNMRKSGYIPREER